MKNNIRQVIIIGILFCISSCAAVPKQVVDAMQAQEAEIQRVKEMYFENINNQLDAIEKYRLAILDILEVHYREKIVQAPGEIVDEDGNTVLGLVAPTNDKLVDVYNLALLEEIEIFFKEQRDDVRSDIKTRREQILLVHLNFENIEEINNSVNEYLKSLRALKESRDKLAKSVRTRIESIVPIPFTISDLPDPSTIEDLVGKFKQ